MGIGICLIQHYTQIVKLNPQDYYTDFVPVELNFYHMLLLNVITFALSILIMIGPSFLITKISPAKTIKFE